LGISRGGLTISHFMGEALNIRNVFTINSIHYDGVRKLDTFNIFNIPNLINASKVLIVDDIVDSGETMVEVFKILKEKFPMCEFKLASLFYKKTALVQPDFTVKEAPHWIDFFWEADLKKLS
jgi:xanthine phosphoribosyltransferase